MPIKTDAVRFSLVPRRFIFVAGVAVLVAVSIVDVFLLNAGFLLADVELDAIDRVRVLVLDPDGDPVNGAEVHVRGMRTRKNPSTGWGARNVTSGTTDQKGEAEVAYPRYLHEEMETGQLILEITHPEFVKFDQEYSVDDEIVGRLQAGRRVEFAPVDATTGEEIIDGIYVLTPGQVAGENWSKTAKGALITNALDPKLATMLIVCVRDDAPLLFSDLIDLRSHPAGDCQLGDVELSPGRRCAGTLSDVPRPVTGGHAGLIIAMTHGDNRTYNDYINWRDFTEVNEDGTFEFPSVPRDGSIQLLADCEGWISASESADVMLEQLPNIDTLEHAQSLHDSMVIAQQYPIGTGEPFEVRMEPTSACHISVTDDSGSPLPGAQVYMSPNCYFAPGASTLVASHMKSSQILRLGTEGLWPKDYDAPDPRRIARKFVAVTDENGLAILEGLPVKSHSRVSIVHDDFQMPTGENEYHRSGSVDLQFLRPTKATFKLEPKGTTVLGR